MNGLSFLHLELTSRCNKSCAMCGRRKMEREHSELCNWGDMPYDMVRFIHYQTPKGITVQFHNNGDPLCYPYLGRALLCFDSNIRCFNTNGKLLLERSEEIIGNLETMTVSVIQDDPEGEEQYEQIKRFLLRKGSERPFVIYRLLGEIVDKERYIRLPGIVATRVVHSPDGSRDYRRQVTVPEIGICLDLLTHMAIDRYGNISMCVRYDPEGHLRIGHVNTGLRNAWESKKRKTYIDYHIQQRRGELPGCRDCHYWGCPNSP
jgi:radical SAM protein with 4Fe4S-binding SPASM domain